MVATRPRIDVGVSDLRRTLDSSFRIDGGSPKTLSVLKRGGRAERRLELKIKGSKWKVSLADVSGRRGVCSRPAGGLIAIDRMAGLLEPRMTITALGWSIKA